MKKIYDRWETGISDQSSNPDWLGLIINAVNPKKFMIGDKVRVTVTLLRRDKSKKFRLQPR